MRRNFSLCFFFLSETLLGMLTNGNGRAITCHLTLAENFTECKNVNWKVNVILFTMYLLELMVCFDQLMWPEQVKDSWKSWSTKGTCRTRSRWSVLGCTEFPSPRRRLADNLSTSILTRRNYQVCPVWNHWRVCINIW